MSKILWCDFETGGVDVNKHSPLSFAMLATEGDQIIGEWYTEIRQSPLVVEPAALRINKIDLLKEGVDHSTFRHKYYGFMQEWFFKGQRPSKETMPIFGGHNSHFDRPWLRRLVCDNGSTFDGCYYHHIDTMVLGFILNDCGIIKTENVKLETLANYFDVKPQGDLHNALTDIKVTFQIYCEMRNLIQSKEWILR